MDEQQCLDCIAKHLDKIVGVKIRLTAQVANSGKHEHEAFRYYILIIINENQSGLTKQIMHSAGQLGVTIRTFPYYLYLNSISTSRNLLLVPLIFR